jgi:hypothetical protein
MALVHAQDPRRPIGSLITGGREDGTGYRTQIIQYPVMCALDILEHTPSYGRTNNAPVTDRRGLVSCPDCNERL